MYAWVKLQGAQDPAFDERLAASIPDLSKVRLIFDLPSSELMEALSSGIWGASIPDLSKMNNPTPSGDTSPCRMTGVTIPRRMTGATLHSHAGHPTRGCIPRRPGPQLLNWRREIKWSGVRSAPCGWIRVLSWQVLLQKLRSFSLRN